MKPTFLSLSSLKDQVASLFFGAEHRYLAELLIEKPAALRSREVVMPRHFICGFSEFRKP